MKFGKKLKDRQISGWEQHYLDYNTLKNILKEAVGESDDGGTVGDLIEEERAAPISVERRVEKAELKNQEYADVLHGELDRI